MAEKKKRATYKGPACPHCNTVLALQSVYSGSQTCAKCGRAFEAVVFQPATRKVNVEQLAAAGVGGGSPCAVHSGNAAIANCERCGCFMCSLCNIDADGAKYCANCFERLNAEGALSTSNNRMTNYEGISKASAAAGCFFYPAIFTGPLAIVYGIKALKQKKELGDSQGQVMIILSMLLGLFMFGIMILAIVSIVGGLIR
jgi:hypothetical protein